MAENRFLQSPISPATSAPVPPPVPTFEAPARQPRASAAPGAPASAAARLSQGLLPPPDLQPLFEQASATHGVPINVLAALAQQESSYRADALGVDTKWGKAKGLMQYIDPTAQSMGIDPYDAAQSVDAAAKQFMERIGKGYSVQDAIAAHHGGDDRSQWGPKTRAYVQEVMSKAGDIDQEMMAGRVLGEAQSQQQPQGPDLAALQAQADAEEPGRYKVMTAEDAQHYQARADIASGQGALKKAQQDTGAYEAPSPYPLDTQERIEQAVAGRQPATPLTITNQELAKKGLPLADTREAKPLGALDTTALIGKQIWEAAAYHLPGAVAGALEGDDPYAENDWKDGLVNRSRAQTRKGDHSLDAKTETALPGVNKQDIESLGPSLGFSAVGMAAGLGAGLPATAVAGPVAGFAAGGTASGVAAYRMSTNQFVRDLREAADLESIKTTGRKLTDEQFAEKVVPLQDSIREYGLWEAIPEAASNVIGFGALKVGVKSAIGKVFGKNVVTRLATKAATVYGTELATETITQQGQHNVTVDAGLSMLPERSWTSAADLGQSFKEIAPVTVLQTTLMAGGTKGAMMLSDRIKRGSLTPEQYDGLMAINDAIDSGQIDPDAARQEAIRLLDPNTYQAESTDPGQQVWPPGEKPTPAPPPAAPAGPLTSAASKVTQTQDAERVTVETQTGPVTGTLESFTKNKVGDKEEWEARVLDDQGQFHHFTDKDGVDIVPTLTESMDDQIPTLTDVVEDNIPTLTDVVDDQIPTLTDSIDDQIPTLTDSIDDEIPTLTDAVGDEIPTLTDVVEPEKPAAPDYAQMDEPQLRAALKATATALKANPKDPELKAQRKAIEQAINKPLPKAPPVPKEITPGKWFGSQAKAEGYLAGKQMGDTHEVVDAGNSRFEIREKAKAAPDTQPDDVRAERRKLPSAVEGELHSALNTLTQAEDRLKRAFRARGKDDPVVKALIEELRPDIAKARETLRKVQRSAVESGADYNKVLAETEGVPDLSAYGFDDSAADATPEAQPPAVPEATPPAAPEVEPPAAKPLTPQQKAKALKAKRQEATRATLGVKEGEQFTMSADIGYATAGRTYTLTSISSDGGADIKGERGSTQLSRAELIGAVNKGVTFTKVGEASNTEAEKPASTSTAPEHAHVGVDDRELGQIVAEFNAAQEGMQTGEDQVHHLFDEPAKGDVVRLADKVKVYQKEHGWMTPADAKAKIAEWKAHTGAQYDAHRNENSQRVVLSFFDLTGKWSTPWEEAGYQVYRFDIQNDPEMGDVHNFSAEFFNDWFGDFEGSDVYAILAACPCTDFAVSGARHFAAKDADGRTVASVKLVHQTLNAIEYFKPAVWAVENPVGRIEKLGGLPKWRLSFDPNHLGDTYTKKTLIWGRFNGDLPIAPVEAVEGSKMHSQYGGKSLKTKNARSATPEGFAYGFFMANNAVDNPVMAIANKYDRLDRELIGKAVDAGMSESDIGDLVDDFYYQDLDDAAANEALRDAIAGRAEDATDDIEVEPAPKPAVSENTVFTEDAAAKARALLKSKFGQLNSGIDPEIMQAGITLAGYHIEKGARSFAAYAKAMAEDLGDVVKPYLKSWYMGVKYDPRASGFDGMSSAAEVEAFNVNEIAPDEPQPAETADQANADGRQRGAGQPDGASADAGTTAEQPDGGLRAERGQRKASGAKPARDKTELAGTKQPVSDNPGRGAATGPGKDQRNYRVQPGELKRTGSWKATAEQNVKIVELVKQILSEKRQATPEEKALLTKFTGWGASEIANGVFPNQYGRFKDDAWQALGQRLKAAMTPEEYAQAKRTTQYAHYTSEPIIRSVYSALDRLGFNGGQVLEPGMGIGLFNGLMPDAMAANGTYTGIEYDTFTGNIAKLLYPASNIIVGDYTQTKLPREFFDAAIGNPPFGQIKIQSDPEYKKQGFLLHDYFFAKTIDRVKPGGLLVFVTSKGTMDKASDRARKYLMERADLLGAIRLPQTAFKDNAGTEVVTDVIFLRKRATDELPAGQAWGGLAEVPTAQGPAMVNEYFAAHPQMVLGRHAKTGSMYRADEYTVEPIEGDIEQLFAKAIEQLPEGVYRPQRGSQAEKAAVQRRDYDPKVKKEGGVYVADDGVLMQVESGQGVPLTSRTGSNGQAIDLKPRELEWLKGYAGVRDALKQTQYDQLNNGPWETSLKALNKAYDAFTKAHGPIMAHTVSERESDDGSVTVTRRFKNDTLIRQDAEGALAYALETIDAEGNIGKAPVLLGRTLNKPSAPTITSTQDALFVSLNERGRFDLAHIAQLAGKTEDQVVAELGTAIYQDPSAGWTTADDYLSGNVVRKLKEAEAAARLNKDYARNVEPLKDVQPRALAPQDITVQLGSAWVPATDIQNFAAEIMGDKFSLSYSAKVGQWTVFGAGSRVSEWGTSSKGPADILESVLNNRQLKVTYKDVDGKTHTDPEATEKVNDIAKKLRAAFKRWIWSDTQRATRLATFYNEHYNNIAPRQFDGSHLTLPGVSARFDLRPHQKRAIWRTIQQGDTYYAHAVGAGKTFTMIAAGMEERRLGLAKKPMYVVPNHMLAQFSKEFLELYPTAQVMVADEQNFHTHNRRKFVAQAALNDPDAIVITHSAFGRIGMSAEYSQQFISRQIADWQAALDEADSADRVTVKQIERRIEQLENRLKKIIDSDSKDKVLSFEELGVDRLYVDEGHEFRKLDFPTNRGNIKGIDSSGSQRAMDLYMKVSYLRERNPGRALVMASGTPVTNTMGELFTVQRFFQQDQLEEDGDASFDAWANHYGEVVDGLEQNAAGGYETVSRFAKFINVPELMSRVRTVMDILTSSQLGDLVQRPDVENGGRQVVVTPVPDGYKAYQKELESRIKAIRDRRGPPKAGDDIILSVISDGRFSAIDMRFVDPALPSDPNSKLNRTIDDMIAAYHATALNEYATGGQPDELPGGSQMLFTDIGLGEQSAKNRGFDMKAWIEQRLTEGGVKPEHIAFMRDNKAHAKKERLFEDLRKGRKRILIGGKDMETGVNAQKRLAHLFHLDAPWFPASVEQREGRIVRQGNQNQKVTINAYATKGSYDSTMWGMNARKARFIEQAMSGDASLRSMEDVSEASAFEMAAALASGDERYLKLAGLKADVERLGRLYSAHLDDQRRLRSEKMGNELTAAHNAEQVNLITAAIAERKPIKPGEFAGTVGTTVYDKRDDFSLALHEQFKALAEAFTLGEQVLGKVGGFPLVYTGVELRGDNFAGELSIELPGSPEPLIVFPLDPNASITGIATRAANLVNGLEYQLGKRKELIAEVQDRLAKIGRRLGASFPEQSELSEKREELGALESELEAESKANDTAAKAEVAASTGEVEGTKLSVGQKAGQPASRATVTKALTQGPFGPVVRKLLDAGLIVIHGDAQGLPSGAQGATTPDNKVHLVVENLTPATANAVLLHEMFHSGAKPLLGTQRWNALVKRLSALHRQAEQSTGKARSVYEKAAARVAAAKARGAVADGLTTEEFGAYAIEEYEQLPTAFRKWADDLVGAVKHWLFSRFGRQLGQVTPAQLRALAKEALLTKATPPTGGPSGGIKFSTAALINTPAFQRWFGGSKVVDAAGKPLMVYHGTANDFSTFSDEFYGESTGEGDMGEGFYFTDSAEIASDFAENADGAAPNVMPVYLALHNPATNKVIDSPAIQEILDDGMGFDSLRDVLTEQGYDGIMYTHKGAGIEYVAFTPEQIKSATGNTGAFDPANADVRFSVLPDDTALDDAIKDLDKTAQFKADAIGQLSDDIGRVARFVLHPRQIAALHKLFTPVYNTAISQFEMRDALIDELQQHHKAYDDLPQDSKAKVNAVLELGRLYSATYGEQQLKDGVGHPGTKTGVRITEGGSTVREQQPVHALLSAVGEVHKLDPAEIAAYQGLRTMFDEALEKFKDQSLVDFGLPELSGKRAGEAVTAIMTMIKPNMPPAKRDRLQGVASFIAEIEQAKRTGYVPFARYGDYVVVVKEEVLPLKLINDQNQGGGWLTRDLPPAYKRFVEDLGAPFDKKEGGYRLTDEQRKALIGENERTIHSAKVEFTVADKALILRGRKVEDLPSVKKALADANKWKEGKPNRRVIGFEAIQKQPEGGVKLADVDALAEVAMLDTATWDAVREQLSDAIKGKSFRKHFFQSDNVPGYTADFERAIADYMAGMSGYLARRHYNHAWDTAVSKIKAPRLFEYATKYRAYANEPHEELAMVRQVGFFAYIAGVPATAFANLTQPLLLTYPVLSQIAPHSLVLREMARAYKDALKMARLNKKTGLDFFDPAAAPADVRDDLRKAWAEGMFVPLQTYEVMATSRTSNIKGRKLTRQANKAVQVTASFFSFAERLNRLVTFITSARLATRPAVKANAKKVYAKNALARSTFLRHWSPLSLGDFMVDETQFRMGKANRPVISRGLGAALMQFKGFVMQSLEVWFRMLAQNGAAGVKAAALSIGFMALIGGLWGMPGADDLRDVIEQSYKLVTKKDLDLKTEMRQNLYELTGQRWIGEVATKGATYPFGLDLSRIGMGNISPDSPLQVFGIPADLFIGRPSRAFIKGSQGDIPGAAGEFLPNFLKNPVTAYGWSQNGLRDGAGRLSITSEQITGGDLVAKSMGFQPPHVTNTRDYEYAQRRMETANDLLKRQYLSRIAKTIARGEKQPDEADEAQAELAKIHQELEAHNAKAAPEDRIVITRVGVQNRIRREMGGVEEGWGRERKQARGASQDMRDAFGLEAE